MARKIFTDESLATFVDETKAYVDESVSTKANSSHNHAASNITSGTLSSDRLPTVPIVKGGTGATTAAAALTNLGITATAAELNYVDGVTSNVQTQINTLSQSNSELMSVCVNLSTNLSNLDKEVDSKANTSNNPNLTYYATDNGSTTDGTWLGTCGSVTSLFDGLSVNYKITVKGASSTTFNLNSLGAKPVYLRGTTAMTTHFAVGTMINLIYNATNSAWYCADYDANTKTTAGTSNKTSTKMYLVGATSQSSSGATTYSNSNVYIGTDNCLYSGGKRVTTEDDVAALINDALGVIENGTY